ncbi:MAG TPA: hypothetical protein VMH39_02350 [Gemmatimonadaceae bacterium]|nr:hypothetical protein [Gemmatimonadaceae bacterium]
MKSLLLVLALGMCAVGESAVAQAAKPVTATPKSIAGEWDAEMGTPGGIVTFKIVFKVDSTKLSGTVKRAAGDVPLAGTVNGDQVSFTYTIDYNGNPLDLTMSATVTGDTMKGRVNMGGNAEDDFSAKRTPPPPG